MSVVDTGWGAEWGAGVGGCRLGGGGCDDCSGPEEAEESAGTSLRFRAFHRDVAARSARWRVSQSRPLKRWHEETSDQCLTSRSWWSAAGRPPPAASPEWSIPPWWRRGGDAVSTENFRWGVFFPPKSWTSLLFVFSGPSCRPAGVWLKAPPPTATLRLLFFWPGCLVPQSPSSCLLTQAERWSSPGPVPLWC